MNFFLRAEDLKYNGCAHSVTASATHYLTEARNSKECSVWLAEGGFFLLALASVVEGVVRLALALLVTVLFLIASPIFCCVCGIDEGKKAFTKEIPDHLASIGGSGIACLCNVVTDLTALIQNVRMDGQIDYDRDLLPCSSQTGVVISTDKKN